jgi:gliding motility-associated-like protein
MKRGEKQWSRVYGAAREDISGDLMPLEEAYYLAAYSSSFGDDPDLLILKTDQQGTPEWSKNIELPGSDIIPLGAQQAILPFDDQNIFLTGRIAAGPLGGSDIFLQRFSAQGESECLGDFVDLQSEDPPVSSTNLFVTAVESGEAHPGSFSVNLFELESATLCFPPLALFSTSDTLVCAGECLSFTDESKYKPVSWSWTFPGGDPATSLEQNPEGICFEEPGLYTIQLITDNDLGSDTAFQSIQVLGEPAIDLGADTLLCQDDILMLDASSPGLTYLWQDGSSEASLAATAPGLYWVVVSNAACTASDTIEIDLFPPIVLQSLGEDTSLCRGEELLLKLEAENVQQQIWSTLEEGPEILVTETGSYSVTVSNLCESLDSDPVEVTFENCDCSFSVPNIFSPNADGLNDGFRPVTDCKVLEYKLSVFDRWGGVIFETRTFEEAWDGKSGNQPVDPDVYVYLIEVVYSQNRQIQRASLSGDLLLVR